MLINQEFILIFVLGSCLLLLCVNGYLSNVNGNKVIRYFEKLPALTTPYYIMDNERQAIIRDHITEISVADSLDSIVAKLGAPDYDQVMSTKSGKFVTRSLKYYFERWQNGLVTEGKDKLLYLNFNQVNQLVKIVTNIPNLHSSAEALHQPPV